MSMLTKNAHTNTISVNTCTFLLTSKKFQSQIFFLKKDPYVGILLNFSPQNKCAQIPPVTHFICIVTVIQFGYSYQNCLNYIS